MLQNKNNLSFNIQLFLADYEKDSHRKVLRKFPIPENLTHYQWYMIILNHDNRHMFWERFLYA